jgi:hypothetical protein
MGDVDFTKVCSRCCQPVSRRPEKAELRVENDSGGYDHRTCVEQAPADEWIRQIFGQGQIASRERFASRAAGSAVGHSVKVSKDPQPEWICTCGMRGNATGTSDKGRLRDEGLAHLRSTYALA